MWRTMLQKRTCRWPVAAGVPAVALPREATAAAADEADVSLPGELRASFNVDGPATESPLCLAWLLTGAGVATAAPLPEKEACAPSVGATAGTGAGPPASLAVSEGAATAGGEAEGMPAAVGVGAAATAAPCAAGPAACC